MKKLDVIAISKDLIAIQSITPAKEDIFQYLASLLSDIGFVCTIMHFDDVPNLYARYGDSGKNICFAGHVDVVPYGDVKDWKYSPYQGVEEDGVLYGRGVVDMKCAVAAFIDAAATVISSGELEGVSISLLITGDEEGPALNGTQKVIKKLYDDGEKIDFCLLGEPTGNVEFGDAILVGRRGSVSYYLEVEGKQGHVAYQLSAINPVNQIVSILNDIKNIQLDSGNKYFEASNIEITSVDVGNPTTNLIPKKANAIFNVRYNTLQDPQSMKQDFLGICAKHSKKHTLFEKVFAKPFVVEPKSLAYALRDAVCDVLPHMKHKIAFETTGGTSDARFMKDYVPDVAEFGLLVQTAHHVNECAMVSEIVALRDIYRKTILNLQKVL